jgi:enediyne biosynthesis protein E5
MKSIDLRLAGLRRFAVAISVLNLLGHTVLGFEQSYAQVVAALLVAYVFDLTMETIDARAQRRAPRWRGGFIAAVNFLLPAHITALACAMLLYANERIGPVVFAVVVAIASKYLLRVAAANGRRHFLNPSNTGICVTLLLFPWVGIAPPYQFAEGLFGAWDWVLPAVLITLGTFLNTRFTRKLPLIAAWLLAFALQAVLRGWFADTPILAGLNPMTGVAFLLFTFYMVTDPATTPVKPAAQVLFGAGVAAAYGLLVAYHVVFGMFFALGAVCVIRGGYQYLLQLRSARTAPAHAAVSRV